MPLTASVRTGGGNLPADIESKISSFSSTIDKHIQEAARKSGLTASQVRILRPCNIVFIVNEKSVFVVLTNVNAGGIVSISHIDWRGKEDMNLPTAIYLVERDLGFEKAFGIEFPYQYVEANEQMKESYAIAIAKSYINDEVINMERLNRIVRINPIFSGRDFMINDSEVFVLSPFTEPFNAIFKDHVKPTVESISGLECVRADDIYDNRPIIEDIWKNINEAKIIISELTGRNPNVFYETGIAHTVGKEVILITQNMEDVPFDLKHLRCLVYDYTPPGIKTLETNLKNTISTILKR